MPKKLYFYNGNELADLADEVIMASKRKYSRSDRETYEDIFAALAENDGCCYYYYEPSDCENKIILRSEPIHESNSLYMTSSGSFRNYRSRINVIFKEMTGVNELNLLETQKVQSDNGKCLIDCGFTKLSINTKLINDGIVKIIDLAPQESDVKFIDNFSYALLNCIGCDSKREEIRKKLYEGHSMIVLFGTHGSGKSTLIRRITGAPDMNTVFIRATGEGLTKDIMNLRFEGRGADSSDDSIGLIKACRPKYLVLDGYSLADLSEEGRPLKKASDFISKIYTSSGAVKTFITTCDIPSFTGNTVKVSCSEELARTLFINRCQPDSQLSLAG